MFDLTFFGVSSWVVALIIYNLCFVIILGSRDISPRSFAVAALMLGTWVVSNGFVFNAATPEVALLAMRFSYYFGLLISIWIFYFSLTYPNNKKPSTLTKSFLWVTTLSCLFFFFSEEIASLLNTSFTLFDYTVVDSMYPHNYNLWGWELGKYAILFYVLFFGFWGAALATIYQKYLTQTSLAYKKQAKYMFWTLMVGIIPASFANIIFPGVGIFTFYWWGILSSIGWVSIMAYSIVKEGQMNIRSVYAELLIFTAILLLFISIFI